MCGLNCAGCTMHLHQGSDGIVMVNKICIIDKQQLGIKISNRRRIREICSHGLLNKASVSKLVGTKGFTEAVNPFVAISFDTQENGNYDHKSVYFDIS